MAVRVYWAKFKEWLIKNFKPVATGSTVVIATVGMIFFYMSLSGAITITSHSGDMVCAGTIEDPCYAYINFTANEDVFLYKTNYDPWGRNTSLVEYSDGLSEWHLYRSWGSGWREINLEEGCTGSWCGCSWCTVENPGAFSYAFREGKDYAVRIKAFKENPDINVKWSIEHDGTEFLDPEWFAEDTILIKNDKEETTAALKLETPQIVSTFPGYQKVAEFTIDSKKNYNDFLTEIKFYDLNENNKSISRDFDLKYKESYLKEVDTYTSYCNDSYDFYMKENDTTIQILNCESIKLGSYKEQAFRWTDFNEKDLGKEVITIGLFTDVRSGDKIEWIPELFGENISEWATWTSGLNTGLFAGYNFNESSGDLIDVVTGRYNMTNDGCEYNATGILGGAWDFESGNSDWIIGDDWDEFDLITGEYSYSFWIKPETATTSVFLSKFSQTDAGQRSWTIGSSGTNIPIIHQGTQYEAIGTYVIATEWHHYAVTFKDSTNNLTFFYDGKPTLNYSASVNPADKTVPFYMGYRENWAIYLDGLMDETYLWNRTLTFAEVEQLYNGGTGITYDPNAQKPTFLEIIDPTTEDPNTVTSGEETIIKFTFGFADENITTNTTLNNVTVNGTQAPFICSGCDGTLDCSGFSAEATCENCSQCNWTSTADSILVNETYYDNNYANWTNTDWMGVTSSEICANNLDDKCVRANNEGGGGTWSFTDTIDTSNCESGTLKLGIYYYNDGVDAGEYLQFGVSNDSGVSYSWTSYPYISPGYTTNISSLSDSYISSTFKLAFKQINVDVDEFWAIDDVLLSCTLSSCTEIDGGDCENVAECENCSNAGCSSVPQVWYVDGLGNVNVTMPTKETGTYDLYLNLSYSVYGITIAATETGAIEYVPLDTCTYSSGDWDVTCSDNCTISTDVAMDADSSLVFTGAGYFNVQANISNFDNYSLSDGCKIVFDDNARFILA